MISRQAASSSLASALSLPPCAWRVDCVVLSPGSKILCTACLSTTRDTGMPFSSPKRQLLGKYVRRSERVIPSCNEDNVCCCFLYRDFGSLNRRGIGVQALLKEGSIRESPSRSPRSYAETAGTKSRGAPFKDHDDDRSVQVKSSLLGPMLPRTTDVGLVAIIALTRSS
jgi:hypothetical protein